MVEDIKGNAELVLPLLQASGKMLHEYEVMLERAEKDLIRNEYSLSIIMSHAATELCTERAFKLLFNSKKIEYLYDAIVNPSWKYNNLSKNNNKARKLFTALTGESFKNANPLWQDLEKHYKRRHGIAHRGTPSSKQEASHSVSIAKSYVAYINNLLASAKP